MNKNLGVEDVGATKWSLKKTPNLTPLYFIESSCIGKRSV